MTAQSTTTHALLYHHVLSIVIVLRQVTRLDWLVELGFWNLHRFSICTFIFDLLQPHRASHLPML